MKSARRFIAFGFGLCLFVSSAGASIAPPNSLRSHILDHLKKYWSPESKIELENFVVREMVPLSARVHEVQPTPPLGLTSFELVWTEAGKVRRGYATGVVRVFSKVAVVKSPIRHNEAFTAQNLFFEEREVTALSNRGFYTDAKSIEGLRAQGYLRPGAVVTGSQTQLPLAVTLGQSLELVHRQGSLNLRIRVKALENGRVNDWIRVENQSSKKVLTAKITGPSEVQTR